METTLSVTNRLAALKQKLAVDSTSSETLLKIAIGLLVGMPVSLSDECWLNYYAGVREILWYCCISQPNWKPEELRELRVKRYPFVCTGCWNYSSQECYLAKRCIQCFGSPVKTNWYHSLAAVISRYIQFGDYPFSKVTAEWNIGFIIPEENIQALIAEVLYDRLNRNRSKT